jgi:4-amino-4-deoxy-L-arabinose transferase-like glycosyltransferase
MLNLDVDRLIAGWRGPLLAAIVALIAGLPGLIALPPLDRDESRFAQATAQMLETGDYTNIQFQDEPRHKKPVGIHWLQAASVATVSSAEARAMWAYRIPSLLGAMLAAAACAWGAAVFFGPRGAVIAGVVLGSTFLLSTEASIAKTDAMLCGLTTLGLAAMGRLYARAKAGETGGRRLKLVFWLAMAGSVLIKGPIGPMVGGLTLISLGLWDRDWAWIKRLGWTWGVIILFAVCGPWALAITVATDGSFWGTAVASDLTSKIAGGQESHGAPPGYHLLLTPLLIYPATLLLPLAAGVGWSRRFEPGVRFALAWLIPSWLVFELAPTKLVHYTLPLYGALAWLIAASFAPRLAGVAPPAGSTNRWSAAWPPPLQAFLAWLRGLPWPTIGRWSGLGLGLLAALVLSAIAIVALIKYGDGADVVWASLTVGLAVVGIAVAGYFLMNRAPGTALLVACVCGVLAHAALAAGLAPNLKPLWPSRTMARAVAHKGLDPRDGVTPGPISVLGFSEPSIIFQLGTDTEIADADDAAEAIKQNRPVIVEAKQEAAFRAELAQAGLSVQSVAVVKGLNTSKGKPVILTLYRAVPPAKPAKAAAQ